MQVCLSRLAHLPARLSANSASSSLRLLWNTRSQSMAPQTRRKAATANAAATPASGEGRRVAEALLDTAEEGVEKLEQAVGSNAEAHFRPAPAEVDGEEATIWYFAFGSNINKKVFEGRRRIKPADSLPAVLPGWRLEFNQPGLPYTEPAFAAVERQPEASNGEKQMDVHGIAHRITPTQWAYVLETEGGSGGKEDHAYHVVEALAVAYDGRQLPGVLTLTVSPNVKARLKGRKALPSLRYMTLIREGAKEYGLSAEYQQYLASLPHYEATSVGQKLGSLIFKFIAFTFIFPVWAAMRLFRRVTGMKAAGSNDMASRWMRRYTSNCFATVLRLHEVVRPLLGCGMGKAPLPP